MGKKHAEHQVVIDGSPQRCFDALTDYETFPDWQQSIKTVEVVSQAKTPPIDDELLRFGTQAVRCLKSNAIAIVRRDGEVLTLVGMGAGQPNRVTSVRIAVEKAGARARGSDC